MLGPTTMVRHLPSRYRELSQQYPELRPVRKECPYRASGNIRLLQIHFGFLQTFLGRLFSTGNPPMLLLTKFGL